MAGDIKKMKLNKLVLVPSGGKHVFRCHVIGEEPILFSWYKNSNLLRTRRIESSLHTRVPELLLKGVALADSGNYTCKAKNHYAEI